MSTDIAGWVEVKINDYWFDVVHIQVIIQRNYPMFNLLFGGRNDNYEDAIAGNRGVPLDASAVAQPATPEGRYGGGVTWISLDELEAIDWSRHEEIFTEDWKNLLKIMRLLASNERVTDVRLIVYFF